MDANTDKKPEKSNNEEEINLQSKINISITTILDTDQSLEYQNYQERLKTKLFKYCESGNLKKLKIILNKNQPKDAIPDINSKFLHDYNVLHIAVSNSILIV